MSIERAIIPAAGYGTRLRPLTLAIPKEMLPLGRAPVLEHVLLELKAAGIRKAIFVVSPGKEIIRSYFGDGERWGVECSYVVQPEMKGLGDAILHAEVWCSGAPALVAFGDCVIESAATVSPAQRMLATHTERGADATVLAQRVPKDQISKYGVLEPARTSSPSRFALKDIVEKPAPEDAPSDFAVAGRWVLGPRIFELLKRTPYSKNGELNLTDAVRLGLAHGLRVWAVPLHAGEARRDIGGWQSYLCATAEYAMRDAEFGASVRAAICR